MDLKTNDNELKGSLKVYYLCFLLLCLLNLVFNFIGSPLVQYAYLGQVVFTLFLIFVLPFQGLIWVFILLSFFEGQGRVLFSYSAIFRLVFDLLLTIMILRSIIIKKKIVEMDFFPKPVMVGISLHFLWFSFQLFNPSGPDFFSALATSKYYIFPFLLFFFFQNFLPNFNKVENQRNLFVVLVFILFLGILNIYQNEMGEEFLYGISENYRSLFKKFEIFTSDFFRPWGTGFTPGGMAPLFYASFGIIFLLKPEVLTTNVANRSFVKVFKFLFIGVMSFSCFVTQVRSASLKILGMTLIFFALKFLGTRLKTKRIFTSLIVIILLSLTSTYLVGEKLLGDFNSGGAFSRWEGMLESDAGSQRAGVLKVLDNLEANVELPLGFGLGMTQGFLPGFQKRRDEHLEKSPYVFWSMDNLLVFLVLELGVGALFYIFVIFAVNFSLFSSLVSCLRQGELTAFSFLAISFANVSVSTFFSWGAVSIPFNPDSFYFWFWAAIGFSAAQKVKKKSRVELLDRVESVDESHT